MLKGINSFGVTERMILLVFKRQYKLSGLQLLSRLFFADPQLCPFCATMALLSSPYISLFQHVLTSPSGLSGHSMCFLFGNIYRERVLVEEKWFPT